MCVSYGGGAWVEGGIEYSYSGAEVTAEQGIVGIAVDYRRADCKSVSVLDCIRDANSSVRWVRIHAKELNIDPNKVLAFGISSGAHLALCTAMFPQFCEKSENTDVSSVPNAVIGISTPVEVNDPYFKKLLLGQEKAINCSPLDNIKPGIVPIFLIHATADELLPYKYIREFTDGMNKAGNTVIVYPYAGGSHDFYYRIKDGERFWHDKVIEIIGQLGWK